MGRSVEGVEVKKGIQFCDTVKSFLNQMRELTLVPKQLEEAGKAEEDKVVKTEPKKETSSQQLLVGIAKVVNAFGIYVDATVGTMISFPPFYCQYTSGMTVLDKWANEKREEITRKLDENQKKMKKRLADLKEKREARAAKR